MATHAELPEADRADTIALSLEVASTFAPADVLAALGSRREGLLWVQPLSTWAWSLEPVPDGRTRLITRVRCDYNWPHPPGAVVRRLRFPGGAPSPTGT